MFRTNSFARAPSPRHLACTLALLGVLTTASAHANDPCEEMVCNTNRAPSVPTNVQVTASAATSVSIVWLAATDDVAVTAYHVYRNETLLAQLGNVTSYTDATAAADTTYAYSVAACDAENSCSGRSTAASVQTPAVATPMTTGANVSGPVAAQTVTGALQVASAHIGKQVRIFVAAALPSSLGGGTFFMNSQHQWITFTSCATAPAYGTTTMTAPTSIPIIVNPTDLSALVGTQIYVGYGLDSPFVPAGYACNNMLQNATFELIHSVR